MIKRFSPIALLMTCLLALSASTPAQSQRWSEAKANAWYQSQPWLVGSNFIPANAINELEMWQAASFDPQEIDKELGWAEGLGMNTMRVFLHDLLWQQDAAGFKQRIDTFLSIAAKHHIRPLFVLFDSCWDPFPKLGPQHPPIPGVHNSGWVQSPGSSALQNPAEYSRLKAYVQGVVGAFANDSRILGWDLWNEPDNMNEGSYDTKEPKNKKDLVVALLPQVFAWARAMNPTQPLTSGVWEGNWSDPAKLGPMERVQLEQSDVISFHNYDWPEEFERQLGWLETYHRPIICTEFMARPVGSTFDAILPVAKKHNVGRHQLGIRCGQNPNQSSVGFLVQTVHAAETGRMVSRGFLCRRKTLSRTGSGDHPRVDRESEREVVNLRLSSLPSFCPVSSRMISASRSR